MQWITESFRRIAGRREPAPAVHKSMVYARNSRRLRRHNVPWQSERTVEVLLLRLCPLTGKRTPDPTTVGLALISVPASSKKHR